MTGGCARKIVNIEYCSLSRIMDVAEDALKSQRDRDHESRVVELFGESTTRMSEIQAQTLGLCGLKQLSVCEVIPKSSGKHL